MGLDLPLNQSSLPAIMTNFIKKIIFSSETCIYTCIHNMMEGFHTFNTSSCSTLSNIPVYGSSDPHKTCAIIEIISVLPGKNLNLRFTIIAIPQLPSVHILQ